MEVSNVVLFPWKAFGIEGPTDITMAWGMILTCEYLIKRGYMIIGWCCMWQYSGKTVDNLSRPCTAAFDLWRLSFRLFGFKGFYQKRLSTLRFVQEIGLVSICQILEYCSIMFYVDYRREHNRCTFKDMESTRSHLLVPLH